MPPIKTFTFKYLNTNIILTIKAYKPSEAYQKLEEIVKNEAEWLLVI